MASFWEEVGLSAKKYQVMPPLSKEEYEALKEDIRENGVRIPVVKDADGATIDGHHREQAVAELRAEGYDVSDCPQEVRSDLTTDAEKRSLAWRLNMQRRHLSTADKRKIIAVIEAKLKETPQWSNNRIAKLLGVSDHTVLAKRLHLERTSQIRKFDFLEGQDGKKKDQEQKKGTGKGVQARTGGLHSRFPPWEPGAGRCKTGSKIRRYGGGRG
jgi:hypothetical protein